MRGGLGARCEVVEGGERGCVFYGIQLMSDGWHPQPADAAERRQDTYNLSIYGCCTLPLLETVRKGVAAFIYGLRAAEDRLPETIA